MSDVGSTYTDPDVPSEAEEAAGARSVANSRRRQVQPPAPPSTEAKPVAEGQNPYDQFDGDPKEDGIALMERMRLNRQDAFYRGSLAGSARLSFMANIYTTPDGPEVPPERKKANEAIREEYQSILGDLGAYEEMPSFGTTAEALISLGGQLEGTMISPEAWIGWGAKGANWMIRTGKAALQQGAVQAATDPVVQGLDIKGGVQEKYDPVRTVIAAGLGGLIGGGAHVVGEGLAKVVGQRMVRRQLADLAAEDEAFSNLMTANQTLDPRNGGSNVRREGGAEPVSRETAPETPATPDRYGAGPEHGFDDAVKAEKVRSEEADRLARATAKEGGEAGEGAKQPGERDYEARRTAFDQEVGEDFHPLREHYGLDENQANDIIKLYDRQPGEHPQAALERTIDRWASEEEAKAIAAIEGEDSQFMRELAEIERAHAADMERPSPAGTGKFRPDEQGYPAAPGRIQERGLGDIPFGQHPEIGPTPARGGAAEPGSRAQPGKEAGAPGRVEGAAGGGGPGGERAAATEGARGAEAGRGERVVQRFETAKGSTYELHADGTTTRDKAARPEHPGEEGPQPKSEATFFVTPEQANELGLIQTEGGAAKQLAQMPDGQWGVRYTDGKDAGKFERRTVVRPQAEPAPGLIPVEVWKDGTNVHFGNEVTKVEPVLASERTAQGEQTLVPGVEPVTDRQRIETQMEKPLSGGDKPPPAGGLFDADARAQGDLLGLKGGTGERPDLEAMAQRRGGGGLYNEQERPDAGVPGAPSPAKDLAIRSLQQQSMDFAKALDFPIRQGRVKTRGALGTFNRGTGIVRVKEVPDFEVVSHEGGHALESKMGSELTDLTENHAWELAKLDYDQGPGGRRVNEGFAEFIRLYLGNPAAAENLAPTFAPAFRDFMTARRPDLMAALDETAKAYRTYLDAPSTDAVGAVRRSSSEDPHGVYEKVRAAIKEQGLPGVVKSVVQTSYDGIFDDKAPVARALRELGKIIAQREGAPVDLKAVDNPDTLIRLLGRARQAAVRDMMDGVRPYREVTPEGPSLADALSEAIGAPSVWGKWDEVKKAQFSHYLIARRAEVLWHRFDKGDLPNPPVAFSVADARMAMQEFEAANPNFRSASESAHAYNQQLLRKTYEGGLITRDLYEKLLEEKFYVPLMRDMSDKPMAGGGHASSPEGPGTTEVVNRIRGSSRDIKDPIESMMMQTFLVNRTIRHNDVIKALADFAKRAGPEGGKYFEPVRAMEARKTTFDLGDVIERKAKEIGMDPVDAQLFAAQMGELAEENPLMGSFWKMERTGARGEPIVFYKDGGTLKAGRVMSKEEGHGLYELLMAAPEPVSDIWVDVVGTAASIKRSGIVSNPTFIITNYIRDQVAASILRSDYVPIVGGLRGMRDEFRQAQNAVLYGYAGGVAGGAATGPVEHAISADVNALAKKGYLVNRLTSFKGLMEFASMTEAGTRNSIFAKVYETKKAQGLSDYEAMVEAAYQAQDLLDFSRHGSYTTVIRNLLPFLNAHMQGLDKARRTMIEPIVNRIRDGEVFARDSADYSNALNAWLKAGALGGGLGAVWAAINWDKESYRDASPYFKGTHVVIPIGNKIAVFPKPFELGIGFTAGEYAFHRLMQDDARAGTQFMEAAWQSLQPPNPLTDIPVVSTGLELATNTSFFTWKDIVPEQLQRLPARQQYTDRTSALAKFLGDQTGLSPIKIEYGIGSMFGTWGRDVMAMSQGVSEDAPAASFDDAIFLRRFVKDPTRSSDVATRFWDYMGRTTGRFNQDVSAYDNLVKGFQDKQAGDFLAGLPAAEKAFVTLKSAANDAGKPAFNADEKRLHPLQHAYDAVTLLNGVRKEMANNTFAPYRSGAQTKLPPDMRRDLIENVRELSQMEMRNALVIMKEPGYQNRPLFDPNTVMDKIRNISPEVADEIATRYATSKIYTTDAIAKAWPQLRDELVRNGSQADIRGLMYDAKADGIQFAGTKAKKPMKRRLPVSP